jgi:glycine dehydrogenase
MSAFSERHIGSNEAEKQAMLAKIGVSSNAELIDKTIPAPIRLGRELDVTDALTEQEYLTHINELAAKNKVFKSYIGLG